MESTKSKTKSVSKKKTASQTELKKKTNFPKVQFKSRLKFASAILLQAIRYKHCAGLDYKKEMDLFLTSIQEPTWYEFQSKSDIIDKIDEIVRQPEKMAFYEYTELPEMPIPDRSLALMLALSQYFGISLHHIEIYPEFLNLESVEALTSKVVDDKNKVKSNSELLDFINPYKNLLAKKKDPESLIRLTKSVKLAFRLEKETDNLLKLSAIVAVLAIHLGLISKKNILKYAETSKQDILIRLRDAVRQPDRDLAKKKIINKNNLFEPL